VAPVTRQDRSVIDPTLAYGTLRFMATAIVLLTRDLRVHDNPALHAAVESADEVVPLFVVDDGIRRTSFTCPNRAKFLAEALADLDQGLRRRGAALVVRRGDAVNETARLADELDAAVVHVADDYSRYAARRRKRLEEALGRREVDGHASHVVVPPGELTPSGGADHFAVFSAYHRRWEATAVRAP
jgi:deoxyribodipyrimidine photo-lyase